MEENKVRSIIIAAIWIMIFTLLITVVIYPMADKMINNFEIEKRVELDKLTHAEEDTIYLKIGQNMEDPVLSLEVKEVYALAKAVSETGYGYEIKFTVAKDEFNKLKIEYPEITVEKITNINMTYRLDTENFKESDVYTCTYRAGNEQDGTSDEIMDLINEKDKDKRQSLGIIVFLVLLVINVFYKYWKERE